MINSISHRAQKRVPGKVNSPSLCCGPAEGNIPCRCTEPVASAASGHCSPWAAAAGGHSGQGTSVSAGCHSPNSSCAAGAHCNSLDWKLLRFVQQTVQCDHTCAMGMHARCMNALTYSRYRWSIWLPQPLGTGRHWLERVWPVRCAKPECYTYGFAVEALPPSALHRDQAAVVLLLCFLFCLSFFEWGLGGCIFLRLLVISCQIFSLENIVFKLSHTGLCWNGNCTCWKSHATQSFKLRNDVIYNVVIFIVWIYFILSINTSIMLFGRKHIENIYLVQCGK